MKNDIRRLRLRDEFFNEYLQVSGELYIEDTDEIVLGSAGHALHIKEGTPRGSIYSESS